MTVQESAKKYVDKIPGAIEGENGDQRTFSVACLLKNDFALSTAEALEILKVYNLKCSPPWNDDELLEKLSNAEKYAKGQSGSKAIKNSEFSKNSRDEVHSDEPPEPLGRELEEPQPFPFKSLGEILGPAAEKLHENIQAPDSVCGQSLLAAANLAVQGFRDIEIDGRKIPISLFFMTISESGERKSAVDAIALKPIREREKSLLGKYQTAKDEFELDKEIYESEKRRLIGNKKLSRSDKKAKLLMLTQPNSPRLPHIIMQEPTYEGLVKYLAFGQPSVGLFSDEGGRFIGGHGLSKDHALKTASGLSNIWDGKPISRVRGEDGTSTLFGKRLAIHLMLQPSVFDELNKSRLLFEQGFFIRFLPTFPKSRAGNRLYKSIDIFSLKELQKYQQVITSIMKRKLPLGEGPHCELVPHSIKLSPEAKKEWLLFYHENERQMLENGDFFQLKGFASKAPEQALRIAATLSLAENMDGDEIFHDHICNAIELMRYYKNEALRNFSYLKEDPGVSDAKVLLNWLKSKGLNQFYLAQILQMGPHKLRSKKTAMVAVKTAVEYGHIHASESPTKIDGRTRKKSWTLRNHSPAISANLANTSDGMEEK